MTIDARYLAPFCVAVESLLGHLRSGTRLELHVMAAGLARRAQDAVDSAWHGRVHLNWIDPAQNGEKLQRLACGHRLSTAKNFRLLAGSALPVDLEKVIYLDADLLVRKDITALWERQMEGNIVLAVQDSYVQALPRRCREGGPDQLAGTRRGYFNSGVMVMDLRAWRSAGIEQCALEALKRLANRSKYPDQDALNSCLVGYWGCLPATWNKQFSLTLYPDWQCTPYGKEEFVQAKSDPAIVHFCSDTKPWMPYCDHPDEDVAEFQAVLRRSPLGHELNRTPRLMDKMRELIAAPHRRFLDTLAFALRARKRGHALRVMLPGILKLGLLYPWTLFTVPLAVVGDRIAVRLSP